MPRAGIDTELVIKLSHLGILTYDELEWPNYNALDGTIDFSSRHPILAMERASEFEDQLKLLGYSYQRDHTHFVLGETANEWVHGIMNPDGALGSSIF